MKKFGTVFLLAVIFLASCKKDDATTVTSTITPSVGITEINIGQTVQNLVDKLGAGLDNEFSINNVYTFSKTYLDKGITVQFESTSKSKLESTMKISEIILSSPYTGVTSKGIKIGSKKADVTAAYGTPISTFFGDEYAGVLFKYDSGNLVESITVSK